MALLIYLFWCLGCLWAALWLIRWAYRYITGRKTKGGKMKCPEWIESWKEQYGEDADCDVIKAEIKIVMRRENGEVVVRESEYRARSFEKQKEMVNNERGA